MSSRMDERESDDTETECLAHAVLRPRPTHVEIIGKTPASEEGKNLPSHLFPGCGSDFGRFRVIGGTTTKQSIEDLFFDWTPLAIQVNEYDPTTGEGSFVVIDDDAPEVGTIIPWPTAV